MSGVTLDPPTSDVPSMSTDVEVSMDRVLSRQHDRCDRCGAEAYGRVVMPGGGELLFCGHHLNKNLDVLKSVAVHVQDDREKINTKPSVAAF